MLIVHPSSTCDICLDGYNWTTPANAPHAIACGHVFCLRCVEQLRDIRLLLRKCIRCLRLLSPSTCPLCRKAFQPDRIKKLHVDRLATGNDDDDRTQAEEFELIQHVALFFGENTPDEDVNTVLGEVHDWLALQGDNPSSVSVLLFRPVAWRSMRFSVGMVLCMSEQRPRLVIGRSYSLWIPSHTCVPWRSRRTLRWGHYTIL